MTTGFRHPEGPVAPDKILTPEEQARQRLAIGLQNPNTVVQAGAQARAVDNVFDYSKKPKDPTPESKDAYDRATESILKYIKVTEAASTAVDETVGEQEKLK